MEKSEGVKMAKREVIMFTFILASLAFVSVGCASAATYYVNPGDSIQSAINAASSGDTLIVRDGTYTDDIQIATRGLTIRSENGFNSTTLRLLKLFYITADYVTLSGFALKLGEGETVGVVHLHSANYCNISNNNGEIRLVGSNNNNIANNICTHYYGISLHKSSNNTVTNNICMGNEDAGISSSVSSKNKITNNTCARNQRGGIWLKSCYDSIISDNECYSNNKFGIRGGCNGCNVTNNVCFSNNEGGIYLHASDSTISGNKCDSNIGHGMVFHDANTGLGMDAPAVYNHIKNNSCTNNSENGIYLDYSYNNYIYHNNCTRNKYGIYLMNSGKNRIYYNKCANNSDYDIRLGSHHIIHQKSDACWYETDIEICNIACLNNFISNKNKSKASGNANAWHLESPMNYTYNGKNHNNILGNFWGDYEGTDADGDGIGDTPYVIDDDYRGKDNYPLTEPFENYKIDTFNNSFFEL